MKTTHGFEVEEVTDADLEPLDYTGDVKLWKVSPPVQYMAWSRNRPRKDVPKKTRYVITSAINHYAHETYIFPTDKTGMVLSWGELPGSFQGGCDHIEAIMGLNHEGKWD